jgi:hypothetical protein
VKPNSSQNWSSSVKFVSVILIAFRSNAERNRRLNAVRRNQNIALFWNKLHLFITWRWVGILNICSG